MHNKAVLFFLPACLILAISLPAQHLQPVFSGNGISIRGLSAVTDQVVWVSGSKGTIGRSSDGGAHWEWKVVKGFEKRDFRDIEAFDAKTAIIMAVAEPANILKTTDGGKTWETVFSDTTKGMFLDAMDFKDEKDGIVIGDPVHDRFFIASTHDAGEHWESPELNIKGDSGEAFFASSGTNIHSNADGSFLAVSGGRRSRLIAPNHITELSIIHGNESTGANSIAMYGDHAIIVGGDFAADKDTTQNCLISSDGGVTWAHPAISPHGYRSCVTFINGDQWISCGTSGVDISNDGGMHWIAISAEGYHVCQRAKKGSTVFLAGANGKIAKYIPADLR